MPCRHLGVVLENSTLSVDPGEFSGSKLPTAHPTITSGACSLSGSDGLVHHGIGTRGMTVKK